MSFALLGGWIVAAVGLSGTVAWALTESGHQVIVASAVADLSDDASGHPLFSGGTDLSPGRPRTACLTVSASHAGPGDVVLLRAEDLTGTLARDLRLDVYVGTGGGFGDCSGFSGAQIYHGSLDDLAGVAGDGVSSGWEPGSGSVRTFEFVVTLADKQADQSHAAGATFVWRLETGLPVPPPVRPPGKPSSPSGGSSGVATAVPTAGASPTAVPSGATPTSTGPTSDAGSPTDRATPVPGPGSGSGGTGSGHHHTGTDLTLTPSVLARVARTVIAMLARPQFIFGPVLVAVAFALVQHRIDAGDPKLANAFRSRRDLSVPFPVSYPR